MSPRSKQQRFKMSQICKFYLFVHSRIFFSSGINKRQAQKGEAIWLLQRLEPSANGETKENAERRKGFSTKCVIFKARTRKYLKYLSQWIWNIFSSSFLCTNFQIYLIYFLRFFVSPNFSQNWHTKPMKFSRKQSESIYPNNIRAVVSNWTFADRAYTRENICFLNCIKKPT